MNHPANQMQFSYMATKNAKFFPDKVFLKDEIREVTFKKFDERTNALACGLMALGLKRGDRVCTIHHNCIELVECYFGTIKAGGIIVPVNTFLGSLELEDIFMNIAPKFIIVGKNYLKEVESIRKDARTWDRLFVFRAGDTGHPDFETLIQGYSTTHLETTANNDDTAVIILKSGTTGGHKGAMLTHENLVTASWTAAFHRNLIPADVALVTAPFYSAEGLGELLGFIFRANTINLSNGFNPVNILAILDREKVTAFLLAPTMITKLLQYPKIEKYDLSSVRKLSYCSGNMPLENLKEVLDKLGWEIQGICGAPETTACYVGVLSHADHCLDGSQVAEKRLYSIGKEAIDAEVRIFDDDDNELPPGKIGEIVLRGPHIMKGYWRKPEETEEVLRNGWLHLGVSGYIDENEYIYVVDRSNAVQNNLIY